jgi:hypothetical protein
MNKLIVALMVLTSLASCGKNNTVGTNGLSTSPLTVTGQVETSLSSIIDNDQFGTGVIYVSGYQESFKQLIAAGANPTYKYSSAANTSTTSSAPHCATIGGVPILCASVTGWSSTSTVNTAQIIITVQNSSVDLLTKKNELKAILNKRLGVTQYSYTIFAITTNDFKTYTIDTALPIQANPVQTIDAQGNRDYFNGYSF